MSIVTAAYLAALAGVGYALWHMVPRPGELHFINVGSRQVVDVESSDVHDCNKHEPYWQPGIEVSEASQAGELTAAIERIEADPDTPAMLSAREQRAIDQAMIDAFRAALDDAVQDFRTALEPVKETLKAWHDPYRHLCLCCADTCACHAVERAREHAAA